MPEQGPFNHDLGWYKLQSLYVLPVRILVELRAGQGG